VRSPFRPKSTTVPTVRFGEFGLRFVRWLCDEGRDFRGAVTGELYAFSPNHPVKPVDKRDLPELVKEGGRENFEGLHGVRFEREEKEPEPEPEPEEVENAERLGYDG